MGFVNDPEAVVTESLAGLAAAWPELVRHEAEHGYVVRAQAPASGKVAVVSGGGAGHEPLHAGFVGLGMLDAACPGHVFTSPVPDQIVAASRAADRGGGVVHIVKNYTGDVMNFRLAEEDLGDEGMAVETVLVADDVAVEDSTYTTGRRGVGTTVAVERLTGAAAERGDDLAAVAAVARRVAAAGRSFGVALSSCTPPAAGKPIFDLPDGEMELGIGIHGEPGRSRAPRSSAREIASTMVDAVSAELPTGPALVMVNGMGGTPLLELTLLYGEIARELTARGHEPIRRLVGNYITSLEMAGASLTVVPLDDELVDLWDAPLHTPALRWRV